MKQREEKIKELFDTVYQWGRVGVTVNHKNLIFRKKVSDIINEFDGEQLEVKNI